MKTFLVTTDTFEAQRDAIIASFQQTSAVEKFAAHLRKQLDRLATFPRSGKVVDDVLHEVPVRYGYRLFYKRKSINVLEIVTIFHGRQAFPDDL